MCMKVYNDTYSPIFFILLFFVPTVKSTLSILHNYKLKRPRTPLFHQAANTPFALRFLLNDTVSPFFCCLLPRRRRQPLLLAQTCPAYTSSWSVAGGSVSSSCYAIAAASASVSSTCYVAGLALPPSPSSTCIPFDRHHLILLLLLTAKLLSLWTQFSSAATQLSRFFSLLSTRLASALQARSSLVLFFASCFF
ncbi:hypothetical protein PIB30_023117 [Stylosanthes scabra]|uniref:Uncharacterized protein n=1 Tax=Stylosanthes scabra TaxID=79078 RepID=A0ABU6Q9T7_9FABA|nr:hypothetical protein [Stylosanthes scabra]